MSKAKKKKRPKKPKVPKEPATETDTPPPPTAVDIAALPVWQIIPIFISIFDRVAWQRMGLIVDPTTQEIDKDMNQARAAIDCYEVLLKHLGDNIEPNTKKILEARLTDLKLNFASQG